MITANRKKKVLLCNEASFLNTGYATYGRELMKRLYASDKYELAELSTYASYGDERFSQLPWKTYSNLPDPNNQEEANLYGSNITYQFGEFKFEYVLLDFQPDIVVDIRDWWMLEFEERSPFRGLFYWAIMPTVDAEPQNEQWLATYASADAVFNYSDWGYELLKKEGGGNIKCLGSAPPSSAAAYVPVADKDAHKSKMGLNPQCKIVGTIMRNQRRKLFPDLFKSFRKYLDITKDPDTYLYCHTCYPDVGWDIPRLLKQYDVASRTIFTYKCNKCNGIAPSIYQDIVMQCPYCGVHASQLANVQKGLSCKEFAEIINIFDLYIQYANSEGFGLPQVEAASCGVPVMSVDYSAMESVVRKVSGTPLKLKAKYLELETGCYRAVPDNDYTVKQLVEFFSLTKEQRTQKGIDTRLAFEKNYGWDKTAEIWMSYFDSVPIRPIEETWHSPPRLHNPVESIPEGLSKSEQASFLIANVYGEPEKINTYMWARMAKDLNLGTWTQGSVGDMYFNEDAHIDSQRSIQPFDLETAYKLCHNMCMHRNQWESERAARFKL